MKTLRNIFKGVVLAVAAFASCASVVAQTTPTLNLSYYTIPLGTNNPFSLAPQAATNSFARIDLTLEKGGSFGFKFQTDAASTDTMSAVLAPSLDGTTNTMDTRKNLVLAAPAVSAGTAVCVTTNVSGVVAFDGYNFFILQYYTNAAATANCTNCQFFVRIGRNKK